MANKEKKTPQTIMTRQERRAAQREGRLTERKPEVKRPYTLEDCMKMGRYGNILFIVFIVVCLIYYYSLAKNGHYVIPFEVVAYVIETGAFVLFTLSIVWLDRLVRARGLMKVLLIVYITVEVILMLLEFQLIPFMRSIYYGLSLTLIICHVLFSTGVAFSLLMLDPQNTKLQKIVVITCALILAGMLPGIAGYRVYASMLVNAVAYIFFFTAMEQTLRVEEMDIDCYGDRAESTSFTSTMFADSPLMKEIPGKQKLSLQQRAKRAAEDMWQGNEERDVLTDREEAFEYEFGVIEDDDEEDDFDYDYEDDEYDDDDEYEEDDDGGEDAG